MSPIVNCEAIGRSIAAEGNAIWGIGTVCGAPWGTVEITVSGEGNRLVAGIIGGGKEMMEESDVMSSFEMRDCAVSGSIVGGGTYTDAVVGDPSCVISVNCQSDVSITEVMSDAV